VVDCRYVPKPIKATTPKFDCELPNGDVIKVKYGRTPERPGEPRPRACSRRWVLAPTT
jgi:hypothetical protein